MKNFVYTTLNADLRAELEKHFAPEMVWIYADQHEEDRARNLLMESDILFGNPPAEWLDPFPSSLQFWQIDSAGFNQYQKLRARIPVSNMGDFFSVGCAETMVGGLLAFYRKISLLAVLQTRSEWRGKIIRHEQDLLSNKRVLILGLGSIGIQIKKMLMGFGCPVLTAARTNPHADFYDFAELLKILDQIDVVINTLPGTALHYVSAEFINAMKTGAVYANVGRAETTDERALMDALNSGKLAGAVLDVTSLEPIPENHPLWKMENVLLTQHTGGGYKFEQEGKLRQFSKNLQQFLAGKEPDNPVTLQKGY